MADISSFSNAELRNLATRALLESDEGRALLREQLEREEQCLPPAIVEGR